MRQDKEQNFWLLGIGGLCAVFVGIGLSRFAYTPILPLLIQNHWLQNAQADYLGAANFVGYVLGAYLSWRISKYIDTISLIRMSMIICVIGLAACAFNLGFVWFFIWRLVVGITGAFLMILTPSVILKNTPTLYRGRISGLIFTGVGLGIIISGLLVPWLYKKSLAVTWFWLAILALIATLIAMKLLKGNLSLQKTVSNHFKNSNSQKHYNHTVIFIIVAYFLCGIGFVPHSLFLVDYAEKTGFDVKAGGIIWSLFGLGTFIGGVSTGALGDRLGLHKGLVIASFISFLSVGLIALFNILIIFEFSAFLVGIFMLGVLTLTSARIAEIVGTDDHVILWGNVTLLYAISQAGGAYFISFLLYKGIAYAFCFALAAIMLFSSTLSIIFSKRKKYKIQAIQSNNVNKV